MDFESIVSAVPPPRRELSVDILWAPRWSGLRPDDRVESRDILGPGYCEGLPVRLSTGDPERVARRGEDRADVVGVVREHVARVLATVDPVDHSTSVGVDQSSQQQIRVGLGDPFLPRNEPYLAAMLRSWSVLREQARPVVPMRGYHDAPRGAHSSDSHLLPWSHGTDRLRAFIDDGRIASIQRDTQMERPRAPRDAAIAQVHPEEVRVRTRRDGGSTTHRTVHVHAWPGCPSSIRSGRHGSLPAPVTHRPPRDACEPGDLTVVQTPADESVDLCELA
jgi:hypothetical protein